MMHGFFDFRLALASLQPHRFRSFLAMLGVVIGVAAVIAVISIGEANRRRIEMEVERIGADVFWLQPTFQPAAATSNGFRSLQPADLRSILSFCPEIKAAAPLKNILPTVVFRGKALPFNCVATTSQFAGVQKLQVLAGRFLHALDDSAKNRVAVLTYSPELKNLFAVGRILNERVWINDISFTVIGVVKRKTEMTHAASGATLYLPLSSLSYLSAEKDAFDLIYCQATSRDELEAAMRHTTRVLRSRNQGKNLFQAVNARSLFHTAENLTRTATWVTAAIAAIALVVGGIGIMNIMLVAVTERTREIGLRRAVGAKRRDIAWQFLTEAVALCLIGGQIGIMAGILAAEIVSRSLQIDAAFSLPAAAIGLLFSMAVGVLSGFFPAYKAAHLSPVAALYSE
jgi:putative ABC transport system permease protein